MILDLESDLFVTCKLLEPEMASKGVEGLHRIIYGRYFVAAYHSVIISHGMMMDRSLPPG